MTQTIPIPSQADYFLQDILQKAQGIGWWTGDISQASGHPDAIKHAIRSIRKPAYCLLRQDGVQVVATHGHASIGGRQASHEALPLIGYAPTISPTQLGDPVFCQDHGIRYPYMTGSMANGIASMGLVEAVAGAGLLGSFGAAGLGLQEIEAAIDQLAQRLVDRPYCFNLIYSPNVKGHEEAVVDLYLRRGIRLVEASAYMKLTLPVVRYRVHGIRRRQDGQIETPNRIIAKASRI